MSDPETKPAAAPDSKMQVFAAGALIPGSISDCWNKIGVSGDGSCRDLAQYIHCRNCPVYSQTGSQILNRGLPPGYRQEWTEYFAITKKPATISKVSVVILRLGVEWLALPAQAFQEVAEQRAVHSIPHQRLGFVLGLVNIRGELLLCISLGRLLGLDQGRPSERLPSYQGRLVVISWQGARLTFPADEVHGIYRLHSEELTRPPTWAKSALTCIQGVFNWQHNVVGVLDPELLYSTFNRRIA